MAKLLFAASHQLYFYHSTWAVLYLPYRFLASCLSAGDQIYNEKSAAAFSDDCALRYFFRIWAAWSAVFTFVMMSWMVPSSSMTKV
jgi:hypothetical protein